MTRHYSLSEKIDLLGNAANLQDDTLHTLANRLDCCTFAELLRISKAVKIMAKGKKERTQITCIAKGCLNTALPDGSKCQTHKQ